MVAQPEIAAAFAIKSYRYLRLTIVVMVLAVVISVLIERLDGGTCTLPSFSAYYYTPAHNVFVGALVTIGACLIAIKGTREWEDMCLNVAGILAPIVAFVPTNRPGGTEACGSQLLVAEGFDGSPFIANNMTALAISGVVVVVVAYLIAVIAARQKVSQLARRMDPPVIVGLLLAAGILLGLLIWYHAGRDTFLENAHDYTAIAMIVSVGVVVLVNAIRAKTRVYRILYGIVAAFMAAAALGVLIGMAGASDWEHEVITIEALEVIPFGVFWVIQTFEYWRVEIVQGPPPSI
jgi:hypothetical protein